jgi:predicted nucleic acid-binding protein
VQLVIADTGPINYLIVIGHVELLPVLFERIILPATVLGELTSRKAPVSVQAWAAALPSWLDVRESPRSILQDSSFSSIDPGEKAAIELAVSLHADLLLMDDRRAVNVARNRGFQVTGTLGILDLAAERGLVDFERAIDRLDHSNFRRPQSLVDALRKKHRSDRA